MKLIGLGGTNGSGKDTVAHMLAERHGWLFVSLSDLLRDEAAVRGLSGERKDLRSISNEWRTAFGDAALIVKAQEQFRLVKNQYQGLVVASIRNPGEVDAIHELGGHLIWVDADPAIRYERIQSNLEARGRANEDRKLFAVWQEEERVEMDGTKEAAGLHVAAVKAKADHTLLNEGSDIEVFKNDAEAALRELL